MNVKGVDRDQDPLGVREMQLAKLWLPPLSPRSSNRQRLAGLPRLPLRLRWVRSCPSGRLQLRTRSPNEPRLTNADKLGRPGRPSCRAMSHL
jgi:hypothetical protein